MLIGRKVGMTRIFTEKGLSVPVTVIKASPCYVIDRRTEDRDGYKAYVLGFGEKKEKKAKKPILGMCKKAGVPPVEFIREFRVDNNSTFEIGQQIPVSVLEKGSKVDITGWSKGRGFQGVVKRWGFAGGPASHGSRFSRTPGTAGAGTYPGRVLKGKKYPGRMGDERITIKNIEVATVDEENGLVGVKGGVPGARNGLVLIKIKGEINVPVKKEEKEEEKDKGKDKKDEGKEKRKKQEKGKEKEDKAQKQEEVKGKKKKEEKEKKEEKNKKKSKKQNKGDD